MMNDTLKKWRLKARYLINDSYNERWIRNHHIERSASLAVKDMTNTRPSKQHAMPSVTVWLRNTDRLLKPVKESARDYDFIDIGCGRGIAALYVAAEYKFNRVEGLDFEEALINDAVLNAQAMPQHKVHFFTADASVYELPPPANGLFSCLTRSAHR